MKRNIFLKKGNDGGFLVLTVILIVCATILIVAVGMMLRSISDSSLSADSEKSLKAWFAVNACGEYAMLQMMASSTSASTTAEHWNFASTTGVELTDIGGGDDTCYIYPVEDTVLGGKLVKASSTVSGFTRKIEIEVSTNTPNIDIDSWQAVADFQ